MGDLFRLGSIVALICVGLIIRALCSRDENRATIASWAYVILSLVLAVPFIIGGILSWGMASSFGPSPASFAEIAPLMLCLLCFVVPLGFLFCRWGRVPGNICFALCLLLLLSQGLKAWVICVPIVLLQLLWNGVFSAREGEDPVPKL